jgi:hypothetical protein
MAGPTHVQIASIWIDVSIREQHNSSAEVTRHPVEEGADVSDHVRLQADQLQIEGLVSNQPIELPGSHAQGVTADESGSLLQLDGMLAKGTTSTTIEGEPTPGLLGLVPGVDQALALLRVVGLDPRSKRQLEMVLPQMVPSRRTMQSVALRFSREFDRVSAVHAALRAAFVARQPVQVITSLRVYEAMVMTDLTINRDASTAGALRFGTTVEEIRIVKSITGLVGAPDPVNVRAKPSLDSGNQNTVQEPLPDSARDRVSAIHQLLPAVSKLVSGFLGVGP